MQVRDSKKLSGVPKRLSRSVLIIVDEDGRIVLGEGDALRLLVNELTFGVDGPAVLGARLRRLIRTRVSDNTASGKRRAIDLGPLLLHVHSLDGVLGVHTAIAVEAVRSREDLATQRERYGLTLREIDVLRLILEGQEASEIAVTLAITKNTAVDYFKSLLRKTDSRNRSEMLAKILGWQQPR